MSKPTIEKVPAESPRSRNSISDAVDWRERSGAACLGGTPLSLLRSFDSPGVHLLYRYGDVIDPTRIFRRRLLCRTAAEAQQEQAHGNTRCRFHQWSFAAFCVIRCASVMPSSVGVSAPCSRARATAILRATSSKPPTSDQPISFASRSRITSDSTSLFADTCCVCSIITAPFVFLFRPLMCSIPPITCRVAGSFCAWPVAKIRDRMIQDCGGTGH